MKSKLHLLSLPLCLYSWVVLSLRSELIIVNGSSLQLNNLQNVIVDDFDFDWYKTFCTETVERVNFCNFLKRFDKEGMEGYRTRESLLKRFHIFVQNVNYVEDLNSFRGSRPDEDNAEYSAQFSPFGDLTPQEFERKILMKVHYNGNLHKVPVGSVTHMTKKLPKSFDWVQRGKVTEIKDQGSIGTCWAFSAVGVLEGQIAISFNKKLNLSVEQLIECDSMANRSSGDADCSEFGGWPYLAFEFLEKFGGIYSDNDWPYCAGTLDSKTKLPKCFPCMAKYYDKTSCGDHSDLYCNASTTLGQGPSGLCRQTTERSKLFAAKVKSWRTISSNETELAYELVRTGPISVAMNAGPLQFYRRGVLNPRFCNSKSLNHAVLLVGYGGDDLPFWKVKNSWGVGFGESGYFRIKRGAGKCGINMAASTASIH
uniref:Peptidase C1A papain C-terminal domain-containing protein n=1 Tax=Aplanochytrium stocchinoi TaxID=215587 RepID=A0A7S3V1U5_9STRA